MTTLKLYWEKREMGQNNTTHKSHYNSSTEKENCSRLIWTTIGPEIE
jgi:hypothetical protein